MLLSYINELPNVLVVIIGNYIPKSILSLLNKQYFYHTLMKINYI